jgi:hypothetical protein
MSKGKVQVPVVVAVQVSRVLPGRTQGTVDLRGKESQRRGLREGHESIGSGSSLCQGMAAGMGVGSASSPGSDCSEVSIMGIRSAALD